MLVLLGWMMILVGLAIAAIHSLFGGATSFHFGA